MTKQRHIVAVLLAAVAVLVLLSSSVFILSHADHDCSGVDCPVCEQLYTCAQNLKNLTAAFIAAVIAITFAVFLRMSSWYTQVNYVLNTPVHLKVKLSD